MPDSNTILFISDLHLDASRPAITELFLDFLHRQARHCRALYILGDLFEVWLGDDHQTEHHTQVIQGIASVTQAAVPVYIMHGNRDFLLAQKFVQQTGAQLLTDPSIVSLFNNKALLMHGDTLCTDDTAYQAFRLQVRDPLWQQAFLSKSLEERFAMARHARQVSQTETQNKAEQIMDVNARAVSDAMTEHGVTLLIHGHTHRPAVHHFSLNEEPAQRIVLGDWYEQGSVLYCTQDGFELRGLTLKKP